MTQPALALLVRFKSPLPLDQAKAVVEDRVPEFQALPGLVQKYYLHNPKSGELAGLYLWDSQESLDAFRNSELRATIAKAYQVEGEPNVDVFQVFRTLRDDIG